MRLQSQRCASVIGTVSRETSKDPSHFRTPYHDPSADFISGHHIMTLQLIWSRSFSTALKRSYYEKILFSFETQATYLALA